MPASIDYYLTPVSPWAYLGHARFAAIVAESGNTVRVLPADFGAIFAASGGLPLAKRAAQRQRYRLVELKRFSEHLNVPLHPQPAHFPVAADLASKLVVATQLSEGPIAALRLCGLMGRAVWADERNLADPEVLRELLGEVGLTPELVHSAAAEEVAAAYAANTQQALDADVFGAPSYVVGGEVFWGQDRLDLLENRLRR